MSKKNNNENEFPDYPVSPEGEDIFDNEKETEDGLEDEDFDMDMDLDVPGSELDDDMELIGEEDEENNYYSLDDQDDGFDDDDDF